jgi:predicted DNA-binding WGR domain protein
MHEEGPPIQYDVLLRRVEPEQKVARFYDLMIVRDLFGHVMLVRRWGCVGNRGRERLDEHASEDEAAKAMNKLAATKRRRGYQDLL